MIPVQRVLYYKKHSISKSHGKQREEAAGDSERLFMIVDSG